MNHTVALPGAMIWMGIRLSSGNRPQSPKGPSTALAHLSGTRTGPLSLITHLANYLSRYQPTISSDESSLLHYFSIFLLLISSAAIPAAPFHCSDNTPPGCRSARPNARSTHRPDP